MYFYILGHFNFTKCKRMLLPRFFCAFTCSSSAQRSLQPGSPGVCPLLTCLTHSCVYFPRAGGLGRGARGRRTLVCERHPPDAAEALST